MKVCENFAGVRSRISQAAKAAGRDPNDITLLAVSKGQPVSSLKEALAAGQCALGENYLQEALDKISILRAEPVHSPQAEWHFIGGIQSNKSRLVAENFSWLHSLDRLDVARRLDRQRPHTLPPLQVCLQVNLSGEESKNGCREEELLPLAEAVNTLPHLRLRGFMTMPAPDSPQRARAIYAQLRQLLVQAQNKGLPVDTLSMGMSDDFELAIAEGATIVRVGSALFGPRH